MDISMPAARTVVGIFFARAFAEKLIVKSF
jgi:hypothetical protein